MLPRILNALNALLGAFLIGYSTYTKAEFVSGASVVYEASARDARLFTILKTRDKQVSDSWDVFVYVGIALVASSVAVDFGLRKIRNEN